MIDEQGNSRKWRVKRLIKLSICFVRQKKRFSPIMMNEFFEEIKVDIGHISHMIKKMELDFV